MTDELPDNDFQNGLKRMGDLLSQLDDADLVWEYASWVMLKDEIIGAKVVSINVEKEKHDYIFNYWSVFFCRYLYEIQGNLFWLNQPKC